MKPSRATSVLIYVLALSVELAVSGPPSTNLLNYISLQNGLMTDREQISIEDILTGEHHDYLVFHFIPVQVPAFPESIVFFFEEVAHGIDKRLELIVISQDEDGIIKVQPYNLTADSSTQKPGSYDLTKLQDLKPEDFKKQKECEGQFEVIEPDVFLGTWPDCSQRRVAGQVPPNYIVLFTCSGLSGFSTHSSLEAWSSIPYTTKAVKRYDLLPYMLGGRADWSHPCDRKITLNASAVVELPVKTILPLPIG